MKGATLLEALRNHELSVAEKQRLVDTGLKCVLPRPKQRYDEESVDELGAAVAAQLAGRPDGNEILEGIKERGARFSWRGKPGDLRGSVNRARRGPRMSIPADGHPATSMPL